MIALVTGASGFLGGRLAQLLVAGGAQVRILARAANRLGHLEGLPLETVYGELTDPPSLTAAVRDVTHIFHCAACSTDWAPERTYQQANVIGVRNLLEAARGEAKLARFLHVSTTDVYGYPKVPCGESGPLTDIGLPYNRTKILGEQAVRSSGLPFTIVRPATIYGPRGQAFTTDFAKLIRQRLMLVINGGSAPGGFCYVDNACQAMIQAATSPRTASRSYNLSDGTNATWRTYVNALADGLRLPRPVLNLPERVAFPLARTMEALPGRPLLTRHAVYLLARNQEYPTGLAQQDFGFAPRVTFDEGMARSIAWLSI